MPARADGPKRFPSDGVTVHETRWPGRKSVAQHIRKRRASHRANELPADPPAVAVAQDCVVRILRDEGGEYDALDIRRRNAQPDAAVVRRRDVRQPSPRQTP